MSLNIDFSNIENTNEKVSSKLNLNLESLETKETESDIKHVSSLAINLEEVAEIEEANKILKDFEVDSETVNRLTAAIGAGIATESVINARLLAAFENEITEAAAMKKTVVRSGKIVSKKVCPEGFSLQRDGTCMRMSSKDVIAFQRRAKKAAKTRARRKPSPLTARSRQRSLLVRGKNESRFA